MMGHRCSLALLASSGSTVVLALLLRKRLRGRVENLTPWKGNYSALKRDLLPADGRDLFSAWVNEAEQHDGFSARVMAVATSTPDEGPTVRSVIYHKMNEDGGIIFGTSSTSQKCRALLIDPRCELLFRWGDRQIRIRGKARLADVGVESDDAFKRLPRHCQLGLQCLHQGAAISEDDHAASVASFDRLAAKFGFDAVQGPVVPCPATYTAVIVTPETFEFYQGGQKGYINDRFIFGRKSSNEIPALSFPLLTRLQA